MSFFKYSIYIFLHYFHSTLFVVDYLLVNVSWKALDNDNYKPGLVIQDVSTNEEPFFYELKPGMQFSFEISKERFCIGYEERKGVWKKCPFNAHPVEGSNQCLSCMSKDFFSCRKTCNGTVCRPSSKEALELCSTMDTSVYVTHVGGNIKVGVSLNPLKRWLDQGSLFGAVVFRSYGLEARRIERELAKKLSAKLSVRSTTKVNQLINGFKVRKSKEELEKALELVNKYTPKVPHLREEQEITDLTIYFSDLLKLKHQPKEIELSLNARIGGAFKGMIGKIIVFENNMQNYYLNGKKIIGKKIRFIDEIPKIKGQQSIFEYF